MPEKQSPDFVAMAVDLAPRTRAEKYDAAARIPEGEPQEIGHGLRASNLYPSAALRDALVAETAHPSVSGGAQQLLERLLTKADRADTPRDARVDPEGRLESARALDLVDRGHEPLGARTAPARPRPGRPSR
jgi:hypothetical protein